MAQRKRKNPVVRRRKRSGVSHLSPQKSKALRKKIHIINSHLDHLYKNKHHLTAGDAADLHIAKNMLTNLIQDMHSLMDGKKV